MGELAKLPGTVFSPAKMVYIAYAILIIWRTAAPSHCEFLWVSSLFLIIEIGHNDWLRIRLNNHAAKNTPDFLKPKE